MRNAIKGVPKRNIVALNACIRIEESFKIKYPSFYLRKLEKEEQLNFKGDRRKELVNKNKTEINEIESRKSIEKKSTKLKAGSLKRSLKLVCLHSS